MKKHLILIGATVLLLAVGLSGCNELNSEFEGYWEVKGEKLIIEIPDKKVKGKYDYIFSNNDDTLEITSNMLEMTYIYIKQ